MSRISRTFVVFDTHHTDTGIQNLRFVTKTGAALLPAEQNKFQVSVASLELPTSRVHRLYINDADESNYFIECTLFDRESFYHPGPHTKRYNLLTQVSGTTWHGAPLGRMNMYTKEQVLQNINATIARCWLQTLWASQDNLVPLWPVSTVSPVLNAANREAIEINIPTPTLGDYANDYDYPPAGVLVHINELDVQQTDAAGVPLDNDRDDFQWDLVLRNSSGTEVVLLSHSGGQNTDFGEPRIYRHVLIHEGTPFRKLAVENSHIRPVTSMYDFASDPVVTSGGISVWTYIVKPRAFNNNSPAGDYRFTVKYDFTTHIYPNAGGNDITIPPSLSSLKEDDYNQDGISLYVQSAYYLRRQVFRISNKLAALLGAKLSLSSFQNLFDDSKESEEMYSISPYLNHKNLLDDKTTVVRHVLTRQTAPLSNIVHLQLTTHSMTNQPVIFVDGTGSYALTYFRGAGESMDGTFIYNYDNAGYAFNRYDLSSNQPLVRLDMIPEILYDNKEVRPFEIDIHDKAFLKLCFDYVG